MICISTLGCVPRQGYQLLFVAGMRWFQRTRRIPHQRLPSKYDRLEWPRWLWPVASPSQSARLHSLRVWLLVRMYATLRIGNLFCTSLADMTNTVGGYIHPLLAPTVHLFWEQLDISVGYCVWWRSPKFCLWRMSALSGCHLISIFSFLDLLILQLRFCAHLTVMWCFCWLSRYWILRDICSACEVSVCAFCYGFKALILCYMLPLLLHLSGAFLCLIFCEASAREFSMFVWYPLSLLKRAYCTTYYRYLSVCHVRAHDCSLFLLFFLYLIMYHFIHRSTKVSG